MSRSVTFTVQGRPVTQGSKNPVVPRYKDGTPVRRHKRGCPAFSDKTIARDGMPDESGEWSKFECKCPIMVNVIDDKEEELGVWREVVGWQARAAMRSQELFTGICSASFVFVRPRPKAHYGTGKNERLLKDSAPVAPGTKPDGLKLARAVEDALTGVVYHDDALIVTHAIGKRYCHRWEPEEVRVTITELDEQTVADLVTLGLLELPHATEEAQQLALV